MEARFLKWLELFGSGAETIVAIGDWDQKRHRRFKEPVKGKGFRAMFRKAIYAAFLVDEFRTSSRCSACEKGECKTFRERAKHVKVWISFAQFEATFDKEAAREVFERALRYLKEQVSEDKKEEHVLCLETWLAMEEKNGDAAMVKKIRDMLPRKVTKQRMMYAQDGVRDLVVENVVVLMTCLVIFLTYACVCCYALRVDGAGYGGVHGLHFPDDEQAQSHLKLLQAAQLWKLKKRAREEGEVTSSSTETDKN